MFGVYMLLGLVMLVGGAEMLVRGGGQVALALRIPVMVVALTVVSLGTSMPELAVSVVAALDASTEMALANVTGSNIANIALVLGLAAMVRPLDVERALIRREVPTCVVLQLLVAFMLLGDAMITRLEGAFLIGIGVLYNLALLYDVIGGRRDISDEEQMEIEGNWLANLGLLMLGIGILIWGSHLFVDGAVVVAERLGLSDRYIGLTVVALGTSAPEAMTAVVAAWHNQTQVAIGNSIGSNILNVAMVLGVTAMVEPIVMVDTGAWKDLAVATLLTLMLVPVIRRGRGLSRLEGALLVGSYILYLLMLPTMMSGNH